MKKHWFKILISVTVVAIATAVGLAYAKIGSRPDKLWLHRCNSIEKWHELSDTYNHIEVDVIFRENNNTFDVTHDADTSFNLTLEPYFKQMQSADSHIWLDIKNLDKHNADEAIDRLDSLTKTYNIDKNRLVTESGNIDALDSLDDAGYYTAYYVSNVKPEKLTDKEDAELYANIETALSRHVADALSFPVWWYDEMKENA